MGIFDKLFGKKSSDITLGAPVAGEAVPLNQVSDPTFGEEYPGQGRCGETHQQPCGRSLRRHRGPDVRHRPRGEPEGRLRR